MLTVVYRQAVEKKLTEVTELPRKTKNISHLCFSAGMQLLFWSIMMRRSSSHTQHPFFWFQTNAPVSPGLGHCWADKVRSKFSIRVNNSII